jgi:hypothetical protein
MTSNYSYTLAELQGMTRQQLEQAFPQTRPKWRIIYKIDLTALLKACILAVKELHLPILDDSGCRERWYNPIKAILLTADPERVNKPLKHGYMSIFEHILSVMVKDGTVTYADLGINDFRTMKQLFTEVQCAMCWSNVLLFVEKDSAYVHLKPLSEFFNINIISGGGWAHTAGLERLLRELKQKSIDEVVVFTIGDYDPFGFAIGTEFVNTCQKLGLYVKEYHRVGINPEHATPEILEVQKYPIERGRKLHVGDVCFNADKWLEEYGISETGTLGHGDYGLEIEAVSGQRGGHQFLREIVAAELLKYLKETDRIEELTARGWREVPLHAIRNFIYAIDQSLPEEKQITTLPTELPSEFLTYKEYNERYSVIEDEKETATENISTEISDVEDQLGDLETDKEDIEQPFSSKQSDLAHDYNCSARLVMHTLYRYWNEHRDKWPRSKYSLGYPEGCILEAVKQQTNISSFKEHLDLHEPHNELTATFNEIIKNGEFSDLLKKVWQDVQRNNGHNNADSEGEKNEE